MAFREVVGHTARIRLISRAIDRASIPPSLLFVGPDGIGKRLIATALAQALNCTAPVRTTSSEETLPVDGCGQCSACTRIARGSHPDVLIVEPRVLIRESAPNRSVPLDVDRVREVLGQVMYRPFEGRRRVIVFDNADHLTSAAQSALLKMLEEPPNSSQFVLVTARADSLMPTVRSRCPRLAFGQLGTGEVSETLRRIHGYDEGQAWTAAASAGGSVGRALLLASGDLKSTRDAAFGLLRSVAEAPDARSRLKGAKMLLPRTKGGRSGGLRQNFLQRLHFLASVLRDVTLVASGADQTALASVDLCDRLASLVPTFPPPRCVHAFAVIDEALKATERNASPKVVADWLACQL